MVSMTKLDLNRDTLKDVFEKVDSDCSGKVSKHELVTCFREKQNGAYWKSLFEKYSTANDDELDFEQFVTLIHDLFHYKE